MSNNILKELYIPLPWVIAIIASMIGVVASASIGHYRLGETERVLNEHKAEAKSLEAKDHDHDLEIRSIDVKLDSVVNQLDRIEKKLGQ